MDTLFLLRIVLVIILFVIIVYVIRISKANIKAKRISRYSIEPVVNNYSSYSDRILNKLFVLNMAPNGMWAYFLSVYFMTNKDNNGMLEDEKLYRFLNKSIAFIWTYAFFNPGVNALRTPIYDEMINIINGVEVTFDKYKFDKELVKQS